MEIGATFSPRHLRFLGIDPLEAIKVYASLHFRWIRLGCYWDEIETTEGQFAFDELDQIVEFCRLNHISIVLSVGIKAPRWPEFYIPAWLSEKMPLNFRGKTISITHHLLYQRALRYIEVCIQHYITNEAVAVWQVENEPLDPSGEFGWRIATDFLKEEVDLVRNIDPDRKILISLWGNELHKRGYYKQVVPLADSVGIDLYSRVPLSAAPTIYRGPSDTIKTIQTISAEIVAANKEFWVAELQAEPWGNDTGFGPIQIQDNWHYAQSLNPQVILWWGFEWWLITSWKREIWDFLEQLH